MDDAGPPGRAGQSPRWRRPTRAARYAVAGLVIGTAAVVCSAIGVVSVPQAVAIGLPGVLLIIAGLISAALPDAATGHWLGFRAGFRTGSLLSRLRSVVRRRSNGQ